MKHYRLAPHWGINLIMLTAGWTLCLIGSLIDCLRGGR